MINQTNHLQLLLPEGFDEQSLFEMPLKGWLQASVAVDDGTCYPVYFCDPMRLQQDLEQSAENGEPWVAEPGLIILPEVTLEAAQKAVYFLWAKGYFASLRANHDATTVTMNASAMHHNLSAFAHEQTYVDLAR
jgi:hypothetical protein